jgi:hypothetical protein
MHARTATTHACTHTYAHLAVLCTHAHTHAVMHTHAHRHADKTLACTHTHTNEALDSDQATSSSAASTVRTHTHSLTRVHAYLQTGDLHDCC